MNDREDDHDSVGYGQPPKHAQFRPGRSGNPAGRPPKSKNVKRMLEDMLFDTVTVSLRQRRTKLTRQEIMIRATVNKAIQGDARAIRNVERWIDNCDLERHAPPAAVSQTPEPKPSPLNLRYQELFKQAMAEVEEAEAGEAAKSEDQA